MLYIYEQGAPRVEFEIERDAEKHVYNIYIYFPSYEDTKFETNSGQNALPSLRNDPRVVLGFASQ